MRRIGKGAESREGARSKMITFSCEFCARKYRVDDNLAGRRVKCKECGTELAIPSGAAKVSATKPAGVDLYGLDDEVEDAPMPPPRRAGYETEASPDRGGGKSRSTISPENESQFRSVGVTFLVLGGLSFVLPLIGLQVKGLHLLPPEAQVAGGVGLMAIGAFCLLIAKQGVLKGLGIAVGGGIGLVVVLCILVALFRGPRAPKIPNGPGPNPANLAPPNFPNAPGPNFGAPPQMQPEGRDLPKVVVLGGRAMEGRGPGGIGAMGVNFAVDYHIESRGFGPPLFDMVVKTSKGQIKLNPPVRLDDSGTLDITVPAATQADGPFEVHFETSAMAGRGGGTRVSDPVAMTWVNAPPPNEAQNPFGPAPGNPFPPPPGNPFGNAPGALPGQPGFRPPGMPPNIPTGPRFGPRGPR